MIPRHQRIVFWCLVAFIVAMGVWLAFERQRGRERVLALADQTPLDTPLSIATPVVLDLANDDTGAITAQQRQIALPPDVNARTRALIDHLIAAYAESGSAHSLVSGAAVNEVFLVPLPVVGRTVDYSAKPDVVTGHRPTLPAAGDNPVPPAAPGGQLAVIDLRSSFVEQHPSGVEVESLTLLSIIGTLHANLPQIERVRFLVDGKPRETLAGHADLLRVYTSRDTTVNVIVGGTN